MNDTQKQHAQQIVMLVSVGFTEDDARRLSLYSMESGIVYITGFEEGEYIEGDAIEAHAIRCDYRGLIFGPWDKFYAMKLFNFDLDKFSDLLYAYDIELQGNPN
jgi:hypothetical protein